MKKSFFKSSVTMLLTVGLFFSSCDNDQTSVSDAANNIEEQSISELVDLAFQDNSVAVNAKITQRYESLTLDELKLFHKLQSEKILQTTLNKTDKDSRSQRRQEEIQAISNFRNKVLEKIFASYGTPVTKIDQNDFNKVLSQLAGDPDVQRIHQIQEIRAAENGKTESCSTVLCFPNSTPHVSSYTKDCDWYDDFTECTQSDCDFRFAFNGDYDKVDGSSWFADQLIDSWSTIKRRYDGSTTQLQFGKNWTYFWVGPGWFTQTRIKMRH